MENTIYKGRLLTSRRRVLLGGLATLTIGALAGCGESDTKKKKATSVVGDLPENVLGNPKAPVTLIEYSSMTCPHCASFHTGVLPDIRKKYIDTGHVRYIIREFPLDNLATAAFMLARCAGPDKYFPLVEALYAKQNEWAIENPAPRLLGLVKQAGFTEDSFNKCLEDKELEKKIIAIRDKGSSELGVSSTPTFFINGEKFNETYNIAGFDKVLVPLLKLPEEKKAPAESGKTEPEKKPEEKKEQ